MDFNKKLIFSFLVASAFILTGCGGGSSDEPTPEEPTPEESTSEEPTPEESTSEEPTDEVTEANIIDFIDPGVFFTTAEFEDGSEAPAPEDTLTILSPT
ncbi:MAG: hypothetical protein KGY54_02065, partial [Oleiphilaceae bacterium]|nr:hypothetical protein [Oleiphilaceae bacterium]